MKILFFIGTLCDGGAERVVSILANSLVKRHFEVEILKYYDVKNSYFIANSVKVTCVEKISGTKNKLLNLLTIRNYFKHNHDIIISFLAPFNMYALLANIGINKPMIVADRNDPRKIPHGAFLRTIRNYLYDKFATMVVVQNENNKNYFNKNIQDKCDIIYNPIEMDGFVGKAINTNKENEIVTVGRLVPQKNQELLIKAFSIVHNQYPNFKLVFYGDGPLKHKLSELVKSYNIESNVIFAGNVNDVFVKEISANMFVLSSNYEGMPNALMEAMCLGLPCISTKVSGATDIIKQGINGYLFDVGDEETLAKYMVEIISNKNTANHLAKNACEIYDQFAVDKIIEKWINIINNVQL